MSAIFSLKRGDTRPILQVQLLNPDKSVFDLAGSTSWKLHVRLSGGTVVSRDMAKVGTDAEGTLRYTWVAADWDPVNPVGYLVAGPSLPLAKGEIEHAMEYEVIGAAGARMTFPNDGYDTLRITSDLGQG